MPRRALLVLAAGLLVVQLGIGPAQATGTSVSGFQVDPQAWCEMRDRWTNQLLATHEPGTWAPLKYTPTDADLASIGLPPAHVLQSMDFSQPTIVTKDGRSQTVPREELAAAMDPALASFAGNGCLGIRPGAFLLLLDGGIGWCSMAHVYGSPGNYDISTAGHCGKTGDTATVIAAVGNSGGLAGPVLLNFGTFGTSHDNGLGNDWALIDIKAAYQNLVTPTMCFWGGPRGMFTKTGGTVTFNRRGQITVNTDPFLPQGIAHYGHGVGTGPGGTPRVAAAIHWGSSHFMFNGAISLGDSGSGANTVTGDTIGANMEAAGIITHIWIDPLMRSGIGIMGGTRATQVSGNLANGQIVPYPIPIAGLP